MANRLAMDKSLAINNLHDAGYSERRIAETLGVSRGAVRRHLTILAASSSNSTKAQTGSEDQPTIPQASPSTSQCEPFRQIVLEKLECGLSPRTANADSICKRATRSFGG